MAYYSPLDALYTEKTVLNISAVMREFPLKIKCFLSVIPYMAGKTQTQICGYAHADYQRYNNFCVNRQTHTAIQPLAGILGNRDRQTGRLREHLQTH